MAPDKAKIIRRRPILGGGYVVVLRCHRGHHTQCTESQLKVRGGVMCEKCGRYINQDLEVEPRG